MALVVPFYDWATWPTVMTFVYGVVDAARLRGWNVILLTGEGGVSEIDSVVKSKLVDRVVLMEVRIDDERLKLVERLAFPPSPSDCRRCPSKCLTSISISNPPAVCALSTL